MAKRRKQKPGDQRNFVYIARAERDLTGGLSLHVIKDVDPVEVTDDAEYFTVGFTVDPFDRA